MKNSLSIVAIVLALIGIGVGSMNNFGLEGKIAETLENNPTIIYSSLEKAEQIAREKQMEQAKLLMKESLPEINNDAATPFVGPQDAKVTLALFYDYSCGYCHKLYPILKEVIAANPDVKFVFKPVTFLGPISTYGAKAAIAANEQGKFFDLNDKMMTFQGRLSEDKINDLADDTGVDMSKFKEAIASAQVEKVISSVNQLAGKIQINGVPTMVLNGEVLQTFSADEIQSRINALK